MSPLRYCANCPAPLPANCAKYCRSCCWLIGRAKPSSTPLTAKPTVLATIRLDEHTPLLGGHRVFPAVRQ